MHMVLGRAPVRHSAWAPRLALGVFIGVAVLYAPVAATSLWWAFGSDTPQLLEAANASLNGDAYARGPQSVAGVRSGDYAQHRIVMLVHTTLGGVALALGSVQWWLRPRVSAVVHRRVGRAYLALMAVSMLAAVVFLVVAPDADFVGWSPFRLQLWVLAVSTLGSAWIAVDAARRGDVRAHRAWLGLHMSFMMTAPLLRLLWVGVAPFMPGRTLLENMQAGSVALAVIAPGAGALALLVHDSRRPLGAGDPRVPVAAVVALLSALGAVGLGAVVATMRAVPGAERAAAYPWFHVAPLMFVLAWCAVGLLRQPGARLGWCVLMAGAAASPWAVVGFAWLAGPVMGPVDAIVAGLMVAPGGPIVLAMVLQLRIGANRTDCEMVRRNNYWSRGLPVRPVRR